MANQLNVTKSPGATQFSELEIGSYKKKKNDKHAQKQRFVNLSVHEHLHIYVVSMTMALNTAK